MRKSFTKTEDNFIKRNINKIPAKRISKLLGRSEGTTRQRYLILGIKPTPEALQRFKNESRFRKGHVPRNKGLKQTQYMTPEAIRKSIATRWRPGVKSINELPDNTITVRYDTKTGRKYQWIRLSKNNWQMLHVNIWTKQFGKVPKGKVIIFKNNNSLDARIENLELISQKENMLRNTILRYPEELQDLMRTKGRLTKRINKLSENGERH